MPIKIHKIDKIYRGNHIDNIISNITKKKNKLEKNKLEYLTKKLINNNNVVPEIKPNDKHKICGKMITIFKSPSILDYTQVPILNQSIDMSEIITPSNIDEITNIPIIPTIPTIQYCIQ